MSVWDLILFIYTLDGDAEFTTESMLDDFITFFIAGILHFSPFLRFFKKMSDFIFFVHNICK